MARFSAFVGLVISLAGIGGCTKTVEEMNYSERNALAEQIKKRCVAQGTVPGTKQYGDCLMVEAQSEIYSRRNNSARQQQAAAALSQGMANASQSYYNAAAANRPVNCRSVRAPDGAIRTNCY